MREADMAYRREDLPRVTRGGAWYESGTSYSRVCYRSRRSLTELKHMRDGSLPAHVASNSQALPSFIRWTCKDLIEISHVR